MTLMHPPPTPPEPAPGAAAVPRPGAPDLADLPLLLHTVAQAVAGIAHSEADRAAGQSHLDAGMFAAAADAFGREEKALRVGVRELQKADATATRLAERARIGRKAAKHNARSLSDR